MDHGRMHMRPGEALDVASRMLQLLRDSDQARQFLSGLLSLQVWDGAAPSTTDLVRVVQGHLAAGEVYRIREHMAGLVRARAGELGPLIRVADFPPPTPAGVLVLEHPMRWTDGAGRPLTSEVVTWGPANIHWSSGDAGPGMAVVFWANVAANPSARDAMRELFLERADEVVAVMNGVVPMAVYCCPVGMRLGPMRTPVTERMAAEVRKAGWEPQEWSETPFHQLLAIWQLLDETIPAHREVVHADRPARRRALRAKMRATMVTVVTLRREADKGVEGARGPLEQRHLVRGHWRSYWVGSGEERHKVRRWIERHESPANRPDLPLVVTNKLYDLNR